MEIRTVLVEGSDPPEETEETYSAAIPIEDLGTVWQNIAAMGVTPTAEQRSNAGQGLFLPLYSR